MPKTIENAKVVDNSKISSEIRRLVVFAPQIAMQAEPGQFVHLKVAQSNDPLLRRPFSIAAVNKINKTLTIYYRVVGHGTDMMARLKYEDSIDCLGPLGRGFDLRCDRPLLIGGGMGIAPLVFLAERLCPRPIEVLLGGRTRDELFWQEIFRKSCQRIVVTTNDGSLGIRGTIAAPLADLLAKNFDLVYACGPKPMLKSIAAEARRAGIPCQVSLEEHMACGIGACLSCTCLTTTGTRKKVCTDGPVFWAEEVVW